jgi:ATP-grasp domain, R2K clade family 2
MHLVAATIITTGLNLLISDKPDPERDALAESFARRGGAIHRLGRFWDPPIFQPATIRVYGADSFCLVLQQKLAFALCTPDDELILRVPPQFLQRQLARRTLDETASLSFPSFIKPVMPKQFRGAVYPSSAGLLEECRGLPPNTGVFVAEPVSLAAEVRTFVLGGHVLDAAVYEGATDVTDAVRFVTALAQAVTLPRAVVVDVGFVVGRGWAVIEFNAAWGAGLNGCDPEKILPAILAASGPDAEVKPTARGCA